MSNPAQELIDVINSDPEIAWAWHCNIAVPIMDASGVDHKAANQTAAFLMWHLFDHDITSNPHYQYGKSGHHQYCELRKSLDQ